MFRFYLLFYFYYLLVKLKEIFFKYKPSSDGGNKLAWLGAYGNTNIGDDLIFFSIKQYIPDNIKIKLSCRQHNFMAKYGVDTFYRYDRKEVNKTIKESDFVLLGGGGLFEYYQGLDKKIASSIPAYILPLLMARLYNRKYGIIGIGCNIDPFPSYLFRKVFGDIAKKAAFIITRDQKSYQGFLNNGGICQNLTASFDPVFSLALSNLTDKRHVEKDENSLTIGFLLWPYFLHPHFHHSDDITYIYQQVAKDKLAKHREFCTELEKLFTDLEKINIKTVFPLFHFSDKILLDKLNCNYLDEISFNAYFSQLLSCDIIVSMRYHGQITSVINNIPTISITVQEKMTALVSNFKMESLSIDIESFNADKCLEIIKNIMKNKDVMKKEMMDTYEKILREMKSIYTNNITQFFS